MGLHLIIVVVAIVLLASAAGITGISVVDSEPSALKQSQSRANILQPGRILHGMHPPKMLLTGWVFPFTAHRASERLTVNPSALSWNVHSMAPRAKVYSTLLIVRVDTSRS